MAEILEFFWTMPAGDLLFFGAILFGGFILGKIIILALILFWSDRKMSKAKRKMPGLWP
jgi:hypothetical protein